MLLEQRDDLGLLRRGAAAADHRWTLTRQLHKLVLVEAQTHLDTRQESESSVRKVFVLAEEAGFVLSVAGPAAASCAGGL